MSALKLSPHATYGAHVRHMQALRAAVSAYDEETAKLKQKAEREGGPAARLVVDAARSPRFQQLREALVEAEKQYAAWRPSPKKRKLQPDEPFSVLIGRAIGARRKQPGDLA